MTFSLLRLNVVIFVDGRQFMVVIVVLIILILKQFFLMMSTLTFAPAVARCHRDRGQFADQLLLDQFLRPHEPLSRLLEAPEQVTRGLEALTEGDCGLERRGPHLDILVIISRQPISITVVTIVTEPVLGIRSHGV